MKIAITGGTAGIGQALSNKYLALGHEVLQLSRRTGHNIPYSKEAIAWAATHGVPLITDQLPIANIMNILENLFEYRKVLFRNSRDNNRASIKF